jgi:hypothetical protein
MTVAFAIVPFFLCLLCSLGLVFVSLCLMYWIVLLLTEFPQHAYCTVDSETAFYGKNDL